MRATDAAVSRGKLRDCLYDSERREFIVIFRDGRMYRMLRSWLTEDDGTEILRVRIESDGAAFVVEQASGNHMAVPWDFVLYHSDPTYRYYKGSEAQQELERDAALRIGRRIRELRLAKGLTTYQLAKRSGILRPNLSRLEGGKHVPTIDTLERLAQGLRVSLVDLLPPPQARTLETRGVLADPKVRERLQEGLSATGVPPAKARIRLRMRRRAKR